MKSFVLLLTTAAIAFGAYQLHQKHLKSEALARRSLKTPSQIVDPLFQELFSDLVVYRPWDLVPQIEITRERLLDARAQASADKQSVFDPAIQLLDSMASVAEERTKTLHELLRASTAGATFDNPGAISSSSAFFMRSVAGRWDEVRSRRKPMLDQQFIRLRTVERDWTARAKKPALVEHYQYRALPPVHITADAGPRLQNPLDRGAYDRRRAVSYPWRRGYYDRYGYQ